MHHEQNDLVNHLLADYTFTVVEFMCNPHRYRSTNLVDSNGIYDKVGYTRILYKIQYLFEATKTIYFPECNCFIQTKQRFVIDHYQHPQDDGKQYKMNYVYNNE